MKPIHMLSVVCPQTRSTLQSAEKRQQQVHHLKENLTLGSYTRQHLSDEHHKQNLLALEACVAGANGEVKGKLERGTGVWNYPPVPHFSRAFSLPFPFPVYACYTGLGYSR